MAIIFSYSLYGDNPKYTKGMILNVKQINHRFPGAIVQIYIASDVPQTIKTEIQTYSNDYLNELSERLFNIKPGTHYFQLKQEVICAGVLTTGKRRYAMYVTNKEGVDVEEFDAKGLELFKSNMNKVFRKFGETFIKDL
jgi:hypothetical protein